MGWTPLDVAELRSATEARADVECPVAPDSIVKLRSIDVLRVRRAPGAKIHREHALQARNPVDARSR
jgi:hypothetical protein